MIHFLNKTPNADIVFSSYCIKMRKPEIEEFVNFDSNILINYKKMTNYAVSNTGMVWCKKIHNIVGDFNLFNDVNIIYRDFWRRCLINHMNIICASEKSIYTKFV
jgi:hypothetical protein